MDLALEIQPAIEQNENMDGLHWLNFDGPDAEFDLMRPPGKGDRAPPSPGVFRAIRSTRRAAELPCGGRARWAP